MLEKSPSPDSSDAERQHLIASCGQRLTENIKILSIQGGSSSTYAAGLRVEPKDWLTVRNTSDEVIHFATDIPINEIVNMPLTLIEQAEDGLLTEARRFALTDELYLLENQICQPDGRGLVTYWVLHTDMS